MNRWIFFSKISKTRTETAPIRYEVDQQVKRRTQSGNSIVNKDSELKSSQQQRSRSGDRSISPNQSTGDMVETCETTGSLKGKKSKASKKDKKLSKSSGSNARMFNYVDSVEHVYMQNGMQYPPQMQHGFSAQNYGSFPVQDLWAQPPQPQQQQPPLEYGQQQAPQQFQGLDQQYFASAGYAQAYDSAPGGPIEQQPQCPPGCVPINAPHHQPAQAAQPAQQQQQQFDPALIAAAFQQQQQQQQQGGFFQQQPQLDQQALAAQFGGQVDLSAAYGSVQQYPFFDQAQQGAAGLPPCLPPGAKLVAEYFLGYLDEPQCSSSSQTNCAQVQQCQQQQQQYHQSQYPQSQSSSESSKEDVDIEVWEKQKRDKSVMKLIFFWTYKIEN